MRRGCRNQEEAACDTTTERTAAVCGAAQGRRGVVGDGGGRRLRRPWLGLKKWGEALGYRSDFRAFHLLWAGL
jgi:hypothetical protein